MSTLKCDNLQNSAGTKTVPMNTVVDGSAKAWVNFNGTGTVAIRASFNVSSITDNGVGSYTVNFTTAMPDASYSVSSCSSKTVGNSDSAASIYIIEDSPPTASSFRIQNIFVNYSTSYALDPVYASVVVFR